MSASSIVPSTWECEERICSMRVEPDLGNPTMKMGERDRAPDALPGGEELPRANRGLQPGVALQRLGQVTAFGFLQRVAALVEKRRIPRIRPGPRAPYPARNKDDNGRPAGLGRRLPARMAAISASVNR